MADYELEQLPDDLVPGIDELPGDLAQLARVIEEIVPGFGVLIVLRIVREFRGTYLYCRNLDDLRRQARNRRIIERYDAGDRVPEIARWARLSERQVWTILGKEPGEDRQLSLF